jgi:hypothetical protein
MMEKEKKMNEVSAGSEKKTKKKSLYENFDITNMKRKEAQSAKLNGNHNFSLLSKKSFI